jgi:DNA ligase-1
MSSFRPLLAEKINPSDVRYPVLASPKYDGFRCLIDGVGNPVSRNLKPIPNVYVYGKLKEMNLPKFDGELLTYTGNKLDDFNTTQSKLSSRSGMPEFRYMVFDQYMMPNEGFLDRYTKLQSWFQFNVVGRMDRLQRVEQLQMNSEEELLDFEAKCLSEGWEGVMVRSLDGKYKFGRSTVNEGILLKIKRFFDDEAVVVAKHELLHNANDATYNALGYQERSSHKANMVGGDMLGKLTVQWKGRDVEFDIGTGFTESQRREYWREELVGRVVTFKYQSVGPNGKPRFPVFLGFRNDL